MRDITCGTKNIERDENGFLLHPEDWNQDIATILAAEEGVDDLNEEKWAIVSFLRDYFLKFKAFPILQAVCKVTGQKRKCMTEEFIDPMKAWKIAGLPKLENIHFISVDGRNYLLEECC